jgi:hypothetical protein
MNVLLGHLIGSINKSEITTGAIQGVGKQLGEFGALLQEAKGHE